MSNPWVDQIEKFKQEENNVPPLFFPNSLLDPHEVNHFISFKDQPWQVHISGKDWKAAFTVSEATILHEETYTQREGCEGGQILEHPQRSSFPLQPDGKENHAFSNLAVMWLIMQCYREFQKLLLKSTVKKAGYNGLPGTEGKGKTVNRYKGLPALRDKFRRIVS